VSLALVCSGVRGLGGGVEEEGLVAIPEVLDSNEVVPGELRADEGVHLVHVAQQPEEPTRDGADDQYSLDHSLIWSFSENNRTDNSNGRPEDGEDRHEYPVETHLHALAPADCPHVCFYYGTRKWRTYDYGTDVIEKNTKLLTEQRLSDKKITITYYLGSKYCGLSYK